MPGFRSAFETPMNVSVIDGEVVALGPDGVSVSLTPEAAAESGRRLLEAARQALTMPARDALSEEED